MYVVGAEVGAGVGAEVPILELEGFLGALLYASSVMLVCAYVCVCVCVKYYCNSVDYP